jgi:hypothetical protein
MIREVCSCGAEFETDDREAIQLVKSWRRTHKHSEKPSNAPTSDATLLSNTEVALGFQALYEPPEPDSDDDNKTITK